MSPDVMPLPDSLDVEKFAEVRPASEQWTRKLTVYSRPELLRSVQCTPQWKTPGWQPSFFTLSRSNNVTELIQHIVLGSNYPVTYVGAQPAMMFVECP